MYKLMVVDDEQIVIDAVNFIVKNHIENVSVCVSARSGGAAIELIAQHKPDIVLMDICMPGMNGLETIAEIKRIAPATRFVVISAYEQFEFAKQAVELNVRDYLLKPVNKQRLIDTLDRVVIELDAEQAKVRRTLEAQEKYEQAMRVLEHGLIYSILINRDPAQELTQYRELVGIDDDSGYIMILRYDCPDKKEWKGIRKNMEEEQFFLVFRDILKIRRHCLIGPAMPDRTVVYIFSRENDEYQSRGPQYRVCRGDHAGDPQGQRYAFWHRHRQHSLRRPDRLLLRGERQGTPGRRRGLHRPHFRHITETERRGSALR